MARKAKPKAKCWSVMHYHKYGDCSFLAFSLDAKRPDPEDVIEDYDPEDEREGASIGEMNPDASVPVLRKGKIVAEIPLRDIIAKVMELARERLLSRAGRCPACKKPIAICICKREDEA